jgi:hypothetical protein
LRYNRSPFKAATEDIIMEAEQLNALSNSIQDLRDRSNELRRYL